MFLVARKGLVRDGRAPALLYGYGGFNVNITPGFVAGIGPFVERGGVYAGGHLRGGGEYGETVASRGHAGKKQNVFDDFIARGGIPGRRRVTSRIAWPSPGGSNGGLLVAAAITQRPDLFRAAICGVPLIDMVRYHLFRIARLWIPEYGSRRRSRAVQVALRLLALSPREGRGAPIPLPWSSPPSGHAASIRCTPASSWRGCRPRPSAQGRSCCAWRPGGPRCRQAAAN